MSFGHKSHVVICGWRPHDFKHEVMGTEFCLAYQRFAFKRGKKVNKQIRADIEMRVEIEALKQLVYGEIDCATVPHSRQKQRWKKYADVEQPVLVVTTGEQRMRNLMDHAQKVAHIAAFSTFKKITADPFGRVWVDTRGRQFTLYEVCTKVNRESQSGFSSDLA